MSKNNDLGTMPWDPYFATGGFGGSKTNNKKMLNQTLSHKHMLEFLERGEWENLPPELNKDLIERILYFRFKGAFFNYNDSFYFLPFTLKGDSVDSYGRYAEITPVTFTGMFVDKKREEKNFLPDKVANVRFKVKYSLKDKIDPNMAVILTDSSLEVSQDWTPANVASQVLIDQQTDILVLLNIDLINSAKTFTIVARDADQKKSIEDEFTDMDKTILSGKRVIVVTSDTGELKELQGESAKDSARYMQSFQSVDNIRKSILEIDTGGAFLKQEHMTDQETETNSNSGSGSVKNYVRMRQEFCKLVNHFFNLNINYKPCQSEENGEIAPEGSHTKQQEGREEE